MTILFTVHKNRVDNSNNLQILKFQAFDYRIYNDAHRYRA